MNDKQVGDEAWAHAVLHARRTWLQRPFRLSSTGMSDWKLVDRNSCLPDRDSSFSAVGKIQGFQYVWKIALSKWHVAHFRDCSRFLPDPGTSRLMSHVGVGSNMQCFTGRLPGRSGSLARSLTSSIRWSVDHVRPQNQDCDNRSSGYLLLCPSVWNSLPESLRDFNLSLENFRRKLTSFVYLVISCILANLVNCLFSFLLYFIAPRAHLWFFNPYTPKGVAATPL